MIVWSSATNIADKFNPRKTRNSLGP